MSSIELRDLVKRYGAVEVIPKLNLSVEKGEFVVLVGPSGCGKSTLLRMIAGLENVTDGKIEIAGEEVNDLDASERGIAMVFQTYALYPHMTVRQNIGFGLKMLKRPKDEINQKVEETAKTLRLDALLERRPKDLSGGQRQRVAIGRAIVRDPHVFLFDEPLSNLDAELRMEMRLEIARLHAQLGSTMVYVTHDQIEAMTLADKIAVMHAGIIEQYGTPKALFTDPDNKFVAGFIGAPKMNFLSARLIRREGELAYAEIEGGTEIAFNGASIARPGDKLILGLRPQHMEVNNNGPLEMTPEVVEAIGTETNLFGAFGGVDGFTIAVSDDLSIKSGEKVRFSIAPNRVFAFDPDTEKRLR